MDEYVYVIENKKTSSYVLPIAILKFKDDNREIICKNNRINKIKKIIHFCDDNGNYMQCVEDYCDIFIKNYKYNTNFNFSYNNWDYEIDPNKKTQKNLSTGKFRCLSWNF